MYFLERDSKIVKLVVDNQIESFEVLRVIDFTSDRKIMSVIVRDLKTQKVFNFMKGADTKMVAKMQQADHY